MARNKNKEQTKSKTSNKAKPKRSKKPKKPTKTTEQIQRTREKRQKRKDRIQANKEAHRREVASKHARGEPHEKPCHICKGEHWAFDCEKYGEWEGNMIAQGRMSKTYTVRFVETGGAALY